VIDALRNNGEDVSGSGEGLYICVDSYDKANAESILFDFVTELQGNDLLIADFGHLYDQPRTKDQAQLKRVSNLVTANSIRVEAHGSYTNARPPPSGNSDLILSFATTSKCDYGQSVPPSPKNHQILDEAKGGLAAHVALPTLGNYIIEESVMGLYKALGRGFKRPGRCIPVAEYRDCLACPNR
jgi:hypothetical protein